MRDEDFRQSYVLNIKLVDCLLSDRLRYADQLQKLFEFLSSRFASCEAFFEAYYSAGRDVAGLLAGLAGVWRGFVPTAIASPKNTSHVTHLLASLPEELLNTLADEFGELADFVSTNLPEILARAPELAPERLEHLGFEVTDLSAIGDHPAIVRFMFEKGLFELTIENLEFIYQTILGESDIAALRSSNYTTLRSVNNPILMDRLGRDFGRYFQKTTIV